jgi:putative endopeptidase
MEPLPKTLDISALDTSVAPGDDFFRFANGTWLDENPVPPEYGAWGAFHEVHTRNEAILREICEAAMAGPASDVEQMVGDYYSSGIDEDAIEAAGADPIRPLLDRVAAVVNADEWSDVIVELRQQGIGAFFGGYVMPDFEDSTRYLLFLTQGGLGLPEKEYYTRDDERSVALREQYEQHVAAQFANLGWDDPAAAAATVLRLETRLADASYTAVELRDIDRTMNRQTMDELAALAPTLDLVGFLSAFDVDVPSINLDNPGFFGEVDAMLTSEPIGDLRTLVSWYVVRATAGSLSDAFADESFAFYGKALGGQQEQKPRWKRVVGAMGGDIGEQLSQLFTAVAFPPEAKDRCDGLVRHLVDAMGESIRSLDWMGEETKQEALGKLEAFGVKIGYPDEWRDYSGLEIDRGPYVLNRARAAGFEWRRQLARLDQPVDTSEWHMAPHIVNAYYSPLENEIVFPAGILQPPFFYAEGDDAVNFGAIGAIIGHEITHGFDDKGSQFDAEGHVRDWWTTEDREEFDRRAKVVEEQFDGYEVEEGLTVNGALTLGENIADLGGLNIAYRAFKNAVADGSATADEVDGYTADQRFFLAFGSTWRQNASDEYLRLIVQSDVHSPARFRCNGPLGNLPIFADAWGLDDAVPMLRSPEDRVAIW